MDKIENTLKQSASFKHSVNVLQSAIQKTGNKDAAVSALRKYDASINAEIENGELFWLAHKDLFKKYADALEVQQ